VMILVWHGIAGVARVSKNEEMLRLGCKGSQYFIGVWTYGPTTHPCIAVC
jgi:hypothetical protein